MKPQVAGDYRPGALPLPRYVGVTPSGMNDDLTLETAAPVIANWM